MIDSNKANERKVANERKRSARQAVKRIIALRSRIERLIMRGKKSELNLLIKSDPEAKRLHASIVEMRNLSAGGRRGTVTGRLAKMKSPKTWAGKVSGGKCSGK